MEASGQETLPNLPPDDSAWKLAVAELKNRCEKRGALSAPVLERDPQLMELVLMWPTMPVARKASPKSGSKTKKMRSEESMIAEAAWNGVKLDYSDWAKRMGMETEDFKALFKRAKGMNLIWPDGTSNELLQQYLTAKLGRQMMRAMNSQ